MTAETSNIILQRRRISLDKLCSNKGTGLSLQKDVWSTQVDPRPLKDDSTRSNFEKSNYDTYIMTTVTSDCANSSMPRQTSKLSVKEKYFSWRYVIVLLLHTSFVISLHIRNCMPMALVCMVDPRSEESQSHGNSSSELDTNFSLHDTMMDDNTTLLKYEFAWDKELQGLLLSSVVFLSSVGPLFADFIRLYIGNKWTLTSMFSLTALITFSSPVAARVSPYFLLALRSITGVVVLSNLPIAGDTCAWWSPSDEKQTMVSFIFSGANVGGIISAPLAGALCLVPYDNGWPFVFYTFGGFTVVWTIAWHFLSSQRPEEHPFISQKEKEYIIKHRVGMDSKKSARKVTPPYLKILRSYPVLAFLIVGGIHLWSTSIVFSNIPFFLVSALGFDVVETGFLIACLSAFRLMGVMMWTGVSNYLLSSKKLSVTNIRKVTICFGYLVSSVGLALVMLLEREAKWAIVGLLSFVMINQSVGVSVVPILPLDMAPRYAGFLTGLSSAIGSLFSISGPLIVSALTPNGTIDEWRLVWIVLTAMFTVAAIIYAIFGNATLQPWAVEDPDKDFEVVSTLVAMGRRFSATFLAAPISPVTPIQSKQFDLTLEIRPVHQIQLNGQLSFRDDQSSSDGYNRIASSQLETNDSDEVVRDKSSEALPVTSKLEILHVDVNSVSGNNGKHGDCLSKSLASGGYLNQACDLNKVDIIKQATPGDSCLPSDISAVTRL